VVLLTKPMSAGACGLRVAMLSDMRRSRSDTRRVKGLAETVARVGFRHSAGSSQTYTSMSTLPSVAEAPRPSSRSRRPTMVGSA
jgi:hypothetical protein